MRTIAMGEKPGFSVGDSVTDTMAEEETELIVIDPNRGRAGDVIVEQREATVAELNEGVAPDEPVISCLHVDWLDRHVGADWKEWPRSSFNERLDSYAREWRLSPKLYDYPASRLELVPSETTDSGMPSSGQTSMTDWAP